MVKAEHTELLGQILDLLDTACQASLELLGVYGEGKTEEANQLLSDLRAVIETITAAQVSLLPSLEHAFTTEMLENVADTLDDIEKSISSGNAKRAAMKMEFQLFPFLRQLKEAFYFWGAVYPDKGLMDRYYQSEFVDHYKNYYICNNTARYKVSVVVVAYNHLEMTKHCVESVLRNTDFEKLDAELILVDHGSTDGTLEYFESIKMAKTVHYKANMRGMMFCVLPQICDSEYYVHVANDTVVTKDWLDILLACAESDERIAMTAPATCNLSNCQSINVPVSDCEKLVELAKIHNRSDPRLWNDRARVLPAIGLFRMKILNEIGFWDPLFYTFDFMDDDFSLRARRHGYRQVLCEDVMCYHKGSATVKDTQAKENTLIEGREIFLKKHGVDAWGTGFSFDCQAIQLFTFDRQKKEEAIHVLGVDCGFGDTPLQIRNLLRRKGQACKLYHVTSEQQYLPDLQPHSAKAVYTRMDALLPALGTHFPPIQVDYLYMGKDLSKYFSPFCLLEFLAGKMKKGGQIVFSFANPYFAMRLHQMLQFSIPDTPVQMLHPEKVGLEAQKIFSSVEMIGVMERVGGLDEFIARHYGKGFLQNTQKSRLEVRQYYVKCIK